VVVATQVEIKSGEYNSKLLVVLILPRDAHRPRMWSYLVTNGYRRWSVRNRKETINRSS